MNSKSPFQPGSFIAAYLRDSGHEDQELSIEQQENAIQTWCAENHLLLTKIYKDAAAPGSSVVGRTAFLDMIQHFRSPGCPEAGIVIWKYNRFARDIDDAQFYKADLRRRGFVIHSLNDTVPDGLDGRFFESAIDWMNARYIDDLKTDIKRGQRHILKEHGAIGGFPPRGFMRESVNIGVRRDGRPHIVNRWVPDPAWWEKCKLAWHMRAQATSYREINEATHLFTSINSYTCFFRNRLYLGEMVVNDIIIPDYVEPMIEKSTWDAVQNLNRKNKNNNHLKGRSHPRRKNSTFLLSGLAYCAQCGAPLNGDIVTFKQTPGYRYEYYACSGAQRRNDCNAKKIPRRTLENAVIDTLTEFILSPQNIFARQNQYSNDVQSQAKLTTLKRTELKRQQAAIKRKINNITEAIAEQGKPAHSLLDKLDELEQEELKIQSELIQLENITILDENTYSLEQIEKRANQVKQLLNDPKNNTALKQVFEGIIHKITVERDETDNLIRGIIEYYYPPGEIDPPTDTDNSIPKSGNGNKEAFMPKSSFPPGALDCQNIPPHLWRRS